MKKVMFAAAALAAGVAFADGDAITSANVVGFNGTNTVNQNNFKTISFVTVGYNTADIQDIKIVGSGGWGTEVFSVWEGDPTVVEGSEFYWMGTEWDDNSIATKGEWQDMYGTKASFTIAQGQGIVINAASGLQMQTSGQVPTEKVTFSTVGQNNFTGNPFPAAIDIQNIKVVGSGGWGTEVFSVWEGDPTVMEGSEFYWMGTEWDDNSIATKGEWQDMYGTKAVYSIPPNQGVVINSPADLTVEITPPYSL